RMRLQGESDPVLVRDLRPFPQTLVRLITGQITGLRADEEDRDAHLPRGPGGGNEGFRRFRQIAWRGHRADREAILSELPRHLLRSLRWRNADLEVMDPDGLQVREGRLAVSSVAPQVDSDQVCG